MELPCPFCGSNRLESNSWYIDDEEVDAWECANCKAGAPQSVWEKRITPWRHPPDMPAPGQRVLMYYQGDIGPVGPVLCTPIHADGSHLIDGKSIYAPLICWHAIPDEPMGVAHAA